MDPLGGFSNGSHTWTGGGGVPGDGLFGFNPFGQNDGAIDSERQNRQTRITPHISSIKSGHVPKLPKEQLQILMKDLKEEGNALFKEKNYYQAGEHYTCGLIVAKMMESCHFVKVEKELLSTLFSNRAACCLKMDIFKQAIDDCEFAISLNKNNIKAYYRKATALKVTKLYTDAMKVAKEGLEKAHENNKLSEATDIEDLLKEIQSHLSEGSNMAGGDTSQTSATIENNSKTNSESIATKSKAKDKKTENLKQDDQNQKDKKEDTKVKDGTGKGNQKNNQQQQSGTKLLKATSSNSCNDKSASTSATVSVQNLNSNKEEVDGDWLKGTTTSAQAKQKPLQQSTSGKKKKKKKKQQLQQQQQQEQQQQKQQKSKPPANNVTKQEPPRVAEPVIPKTPYSGKFSTIDGDASSSSDDHFSLDEEDNNYKDEEEEREDDVVNGSAKPLQQQESWGDQVESVNGSQDTKAADAMGLDDFGYGGYGGYGDSSGLDAFPSLHQTTFNYNETPYQSKQQSQKQKKASVQDLDNSFGYSYNKPDNREIGEWQEQRGKQPVIKLAQEKPVKKTRPKVALTDFPVFEPEAVVYPFTTRYSFTLACANCYVKVGDGAQGYKSMPGLQHDCDHNVLLIRYKNKPEKPDWIKIRPRPNATFAGKYMLCKTFPFGKSCKVGEYKCTFAHYQEEIHLWQLDRDETINIPEFIHRTRELAFQGLMKKTLNGVVIADVGDDVRVRSVPVIPPLMATPVQPPPHLGGPAYNIPGASFSQGIGVVSPLPQPSMTFTNSSYQQQQQKPSLLGDYPQGHVKKGLLGDSPYDYEASQHQQNLMNFYAYEDGNTQVHKEVFPLIDTHHFRITCTTCLQPSPYHGVFVIASNPHTCVQDSLAVQVKGERTWFKIRERKKHRDFEGRYILCRNYCANPPELCMTEEDQCSFAHNRIEQFLWGLEKDSKFNIQEFILQHRTGGLQAKLFSVSDLYHRHVGDFAFLCRACFFGHPPRITQQHKVSRDMCMAGHPWQDNRHLVFLTRDPAKGQTLIKPIEPRPFTHNTAFFLLCKNGQFCIRKAAKQCKFAHSPVERDVWLVERDTDINRDQLVQQYYEVHNSIQQQAATSVSDGGSGRSTPSSTTSMAVPSPSTGATSSKQTKGKTKNTAKDKSTKCPFQIVEVCAVCWKQGQKCTQDKKREDRCTGKGMGHTWSIHKMCVLLTKTKALKEIRTMPASNMTKGMSFIICQKIQEKQKCTYSDRCTFAHSMEEMEIWNWMVANKVKTYTAMAEICRKENEEERQTKAIGKGQAVVTATPTQPGAYRTPVMPGFNPLDLVSSVLYCPYCSVQCNSQKQWDEHCASEQHMFNVNSDREHQWNFRQPPWGVHNGKYVICDTHEKGKCRYSNVPDMHNLCKNAHSQAELDEWKERWDWRQMKKELAKKDKVYSYMEELLEDFEEAESGVTVLKESIADVVVGCDEKFNIFKENKKSSFQWIFKVQCQRKLQKVALLLNEDRLHFHLKMGDGSQSQIAPGDCFVTEDLVMGLDNMYEVKVGFSGGLFGSFTQWLVLDFGSKPVLVKKLNVELGTQFVQDRVKTLREKLTFDRWTGHNRHIVKFNTDRASATSSALTHNSLDSQLLKQYKVPSSADAVVTAESVGVEINRHNYVHKMHKILMIEELFRSQMIADYNLNTELELMRSITESSLILAKSGELFAKVSLNDQLSEDTNAGKLILTSVHSVLIAPQETANHTVYEAMIVNKELFDYDGKGKDYIYLCLSPRCVKELNLAAGDSLLVEVQFQMNRLQFCQMHYAVDQLKSNDMVFPDISKINPAWNEKHTLRLSTSILNDDQMEIVRHIVAEYEGYTPPLIIYGPFGTGKTETLAQATMVLACNKPDAKILICTHSNSAADLYITKHLDSFLTNEAPHMRMLRIYFQERRINTVTNTVQKYCPKVGNISFRMPTKDEVVNSNIVITTLNTSLVLTTLQLEGHFSHIFIDEAAQAMESETIMPLSLATEKTCVVMAGDHMQIGAKAYSLEAKKQNLDKSLLERIFRHYEAYEAHIDKNRPLKILLKQNYRSKMEILRFISAISYGGPQKLLCRSDQKEVVGVVPLTFYVAQGKEVQESDSTSYYNPAEAEEIVTRVEELYNNWPESEWGERRAEFIGVVTPYTDQVNRIRSLLRKKGSELRSVVVERIMNMQGKEFRAVFISTVRTRHVADHPPKPSKFATECDGDYGDFGFLSDQKLLNTALTRAQSFVAVVGDPIALCAIGDCLNIWRAYLKHCNQLKSIYPSDYTLNNVRSQVAKLIHSPLGPNIAYINSLTQDIDDNFVVKDQRHNQASGVPVTQQQPETLPFNFAAVVKEEKGAAGRQGAVGALQPVVGAGATSPQKSNSSNHYLSYEEIVSSSLDETLLLKQLCLDALRKRGGGSNVTLGSIDFRWLEIEEEDGHALIKYDEEEELSKGDDDSEDLNDSFGDELGGLLVKKTATVEYSATQLQDLMQRNPFIYKHCLVYLEDEENRFAKTLDPASQVDKIRLSSRARCGRAVHGDQVVVEILHDKEQTTVVSVTDNKQEKYEPQGQVVGVLSRGVQIMDRLFVCSVLAESTGKFQPLTSGIPVIYNLESKSRAQRARKGYVSVYSITGEKEIVFSHHEAVGDNEKNNLFVLRVIKWDGSFHSPLGLVLGVLPRGDDLTTSLQILQVENSLPPAAFSAEAQRDLGKDFPEGYQLPDATVRKRLDLRTKAIFTIATPCSGSSDNGSSSTRSPLSHAFSLDMISNEQLLLGVHISDVTYFVKRDSNIDFEASQRATTFKVFENGISSERSVNALPNRLSTNLCSLLPMKDRLTLSLFFTIDALGNLVRMTPKKTIIQSQCHLSLVDVQNLLQNRVEGRVRELSAELQLAVVGLNRVAQMWRRDRLGMDNLYATPDHNPDTFDAEVLVEEVLMFVNKNVASTLLQSQPVTTPLLVQTLPSHTDMASWRSGFAKFAQSTVGLARHFLPPGQICSCDGLCTCITAPLTPHNQSLVLSGEQWSAIREALVQGDIKSIEAPVLDVHSKPQILIAWNELNDVLRREQFVCSGETLDKGHYEYNVESVTSITSPLTSFMDLVMHRIFVAASKGQNCPYSSQDIIKLCTQVNDANERSRRLEHKSRSLQIALHVKNHPVNMFTFIRSVQTEDQKKNNSIQLEYSNKLNPVLPTELNVQLISAPRCKMSTPGDVMEGLVLQMPLSIHNSELPGFPDEVWPQFVSVPSAQWLKLLGAVKEGDQTGTLEAAIHANETLTDVSQNASALHTSDDEVNVMLKPGNVAKIQLSAGVVDGILQPIIQLFSPVPKLVFCAEHKYDPFKCFVKNHIMPAVAASQLSYTDISDYRRKWQPILQLEAAELSMKEMRPVVINNVVIQWQKAATGENGEMVYQASLKLPLEFCHKKKLLFALDQYTLDMFNMFGANKNYNTYFTSTEEESSFVCVRHPYIPSLEATPDLLTSNASFNNSDRAEVKPMYTWVGHCVLEKTLVHAGLVELTLRLVQSAVQMPSVLLDQPMPAHIEVILKPNVIRTCQKALKAMNDASALCKDIILGQPSQPLDATYLRWLDQITRAPLPGNQVQLDQIQSQVLHRSITSAFSVVQGVAGSGKTVILVRLAYYFIQVNRMVYEINVKLNGSCAKPVVMICAPTELCLDVIEGYIDHYGNIKVSRPVFNTFYDPSEYQQSDVVMCTISNALEMRKLGDKYLNITQLLIDHANMVTEPEIAIPLAYYTPHQVTLFGDDKQQAPAVNNERAAKLGLGTSLFSRYISKAIKLTKQFRMHEAISEFPAQSLYRTVIEAGRAEQNKASMLKFWPQSRENPIAFVHIEGTVDFLDRKHKEESKFNVEEINQVVKVATNLVRRYHANASEVAVLSNYPEHCKKVKEMLVSKGEGLITVATATEATGHEWEYVILSCVSSLPASHIETHPHDAWIQRHLGKATLAGNLCVGLTRAKKGLIIIGNKNLLQFDNHWRDLLRHYDTIEKIVDAKVFMTTK